MKIFNMSVVALSVAITLNAAAYAEDFIPVSEENNLETITEIAEQPFAQESVVEEVEVLTASEQLERYLESKPSWEEGYNAEKKRIFVIQSVSFTTKDPKSDPDFIQKRSRFALRASVEAKAEVVRYMNEEMEAIDQFTTPGTDVNDQLQGKYNAITAKFEEKQKELLKLLKERDAAEAEKQEGVTWGDRREAYFDALIRKIDETYDSANIQAEKDTRYTKVKAEYNAVLVEFNALKDEAESIKSQVTEESYTGINAYAKAPILGTSIVAQSESYDPESGDYEVAVLMVWSKKLERGATAILTGEDYKPKPKHGMTVQQWLRNQDVATMVGPRQFVDKDGERWFMGAYAMPMNVKGSKKNKNKKFAQLNARKETAMALYSDIETFEASEELMQTRADANGNEETHIANSLEATLTAKLSKRNVKGSSKLLSKTVRHPVSGQKIFVVVYGISGKAAKSALQMQTDLYKSAIKINKVIQKDVAVSKVREKELANSKKAVEISTVSSGLNNGKSSVSSQRVETFETKQTTRSTSNSVINAPAFDDDDF